MVDVTVITDDEPEEIAEGEEIAAEVVAEAASDIAEAQADSAVEIAAIEADKEITIAAIHAEAQVEAIRAGNEGNEQWQLNIETLQAENRELREAMAELRETMASLIPSPAQTAEALGNLPNLSESAGADLPAVEPEALPPANEPELRKPKRSRWI